MSTRGLLRAAPLVAVLALPAPAHALIGRAFVSAAKGTDAPSCGPAAAPCRTFQFTHDNIIAPGGEIDVLDPGGYGPVTITKALSIVNDGVGLAGVQTGVGVGVQISAGATDKVFLRGLNIEGLGTAEDGVRVTSAGAVTIVDTTIRHFSTQGILVATSSSTVEFLFERVTASENGNNGIAVFPPANSSIKGLVKQATLTNNLFSGLALKASSAAKIAVTAVDSVASGNTNNGFVASAAATVGAVTLMLDRVVSANNNIGIAATSLGIIHMTRSTITRNGTGMFSNVGCTIDSFGDNAIIDNSFESSGAGAFNTVTLK